MKKQGSLLIGVMPVLVLLIATSAFLFPPAAGAQTPPPERPGPPPERPELPPERPEQPPGRTDPPPIGVPGDVGDESSGLLFPCSTVYGMVMNLGYRGEGKLPVRLSGPGWQTAKITDDNGYYASDCLGVGVGLLNAEVRPGTTPLTFDVAVRLGYKHNTEVNLGLYSGDVAPPLAVTHAMTVSNSSVDSGETVTYTITVAAPPGGNRKLWRVIVTDLLPNEFMPASATSTAGSVEMWGNLLTADIGNLEPGQEVVVTLTATLDEGVSPGTVITNRASLLRPGQVVVQTAPITVTVN